MVSILINKTLEIVTRQTTENKFKDYLKYTKALLIHSNTRKMVYFSICVEEPSLQLQVYWEQKMQKSVTNGKLWKSSEDRCGQIWQFENCKVSVTDSLIFFYKF